MKDSIGRTPLHSVVRNENLAVFQPQLDAGDNPNVRGNLCEETLLHNAAACNENPAAAQALLDAGADPNARSELGYTPLHEAVWNDRTTGVDGQGKGALYDRSWYHVQELRYPH